MRFESEKKSFLDADINKRGRNRGYFRHIPLMMVTHTSVIKENISQNLLRKIITSDAGTERDASAETMLILSSLVLSLSGRLCVDPTFT